MTPPPPTGPPRRDLLLGLAGAVVTGSFLAAQARVNSALATELGNGLVAALVSFGTGLVLLLGLLAVVPAGRRGAGRALRAGRAGRLRWWQFLGGLGGAALIASQGLTAAALGTALFTVAVVAGQSAGGLAVDRAGLGPAGMRALTVPRVAGAVLMLGAVGLSVGPALRTSAPVLLAVLPLVAGAAVAVQQAVNGRVAAAAGGTVGDPDGTPRGAGGFAGSVLPAATVNFVVGTAGLALAAGVSVALLGPPAPLPAAPWLYLGGPFGALFIGLATWAVGRIGVLLLSLGAVAGQIVAAVAIDAMVPSAAGTPGPATVLGAALTLVAAGIASLPARRDRPGVALPSWGP